MDEHRLYIDGAWVSGSGLLDVTNKYTGEVIGVVHTPTAAEVDALLATRS